MLKGIPSILPSDLLKILMEMGHSDEIIIGDGNFPAANTAKLARAPLIRCDGHDVPGILAAIMQLFPLDQYVDQPAALMQVGAQDQGKVQVSRWAEYEEIILQQEPNFSDFEMLERFAFYERARRCYAVIGTGDTEIYANIILKKGVL